MSELEIWNEIGEIYSHTGEYEKAIRTYKKAIELSPDFSQSYKNLASIYVLQGRHAEAIPLFKKGIELLDKPIDKAYLWDQLGDVYRKLGDAMNASISYQKAIDLDPEDTCFQENLAEDIQAARITTSKPATENSQPDLSSSGAGLPEASAPENESDNKKEPTLPETGNMETEKACWVFEDNGTTSKIKENTPDTSQPSPMVLGSRILSDSEGKKDISEESNAPEGAEMPDLTVAQGSDAIDSFDVDAINPASLAGGLSLIAEPETAESTFSTRGLLRLGILHWRKKEYERAIQLLKMAIRAPDKVQDQFLEALCYNAIALVDTDLGKYEDAIQAYQSAANLAPEQIFPWNDLGNLNSKLDHYDEARAAFQEAIERNPKDPVSWNGLGDVYHKLGRNEDAIVAYQLGNVFDKRRPDESAIKEFERSIDSDQEKPQVWNEAGNIYYSIEAYDEAIASYRKAIQLDPNNADFQSDLEKAERFHKGINNEPQPLIEPESEVASQIERIVAEETSPDSKRADGTQPDSAGAEKNQVTEAPPEKPAGEPDTVADTEPDAPYWMFNTVPPRVSPKRTTPHNLPVVVETVMSTAKEKPSFSGRRHYEQVFPNEQVLTDTPQNPASLLVQLTPHAARPFHEQDSLDIAVAEDNLKVPGVEVAPELPKTNPQPAEWRNKDYALQFLASENQSADQPQPDHKTLDNDITVYRRVIEQNPRNDRAWDALGNMYETIGLHAEAASAFEQASILDPQREVYLYHLGIALAYQKQYDKAIRALKRVVELNPSYILAHCALAGCYRRFGKETEAQEHIRIARPSMKDENEYNQACFESISGNADRAFELLEVALNKQEIQPALVRSDPDLDFIRQDARFEVLLYRNKTISQ